MIEIFYLNNNSNKKLIFLFITEPYIKIIQSAKQLFDMYGTIAGLIFTMMVIGFIPNFAMSVASFVIAGQSTNITCDGSMMPLPIWLNVNAAVTMAFCTIIIIFIIALLVSVFKLMENDSDDEMVVGIIASFMLIFYVTIVIFTFFLLAWNIVGAVSLFRDSMDCLNQAKPLWAMVLACLIFQWISMFTNWCSGKSKKKE